MSSKYSVSEPPRGSPAERRVPGYQAPPRLNREWTGQGAVFLCAVLWSTAGLFIKLIDWNPLVIAGGRSLVAAVFMAALRFMVPGREKKPFKLSQLWAGGTAYALTMVLFVVANKMTSAANAILLQYSAPVWAALFGWVLAGEKPRKAHWISLVMVTGGLVLFFRDGLGNGSFAGDSIALAAGIFFGANSAIMRVQKGEPSDSLLFAHILAAAICVPFALVHPPAFSAESIAAILFLGLIQIGLASLLFSYGIKRLPAVQAMLTATAEPVLNPVWVFLAVGERPPPASIFGGLVIVAAVLVSTLGKPNTS
ncbi:MAG: DMT family transporter [Treponema sp.]|jgi:drug/metabolite transporter (DMT)-like permease|nr:DMT family transporter [Treponema sp.]